MGMNDGFSVMGPETVLEEINVDVLEADFWPMSAGEILR